MVLVVVLAVLWAVVVLMTIGACIAAGRADREALERPASLLGALDEPAIVIARDLRPLAGLSQRP